MKYKRQVQISTLTLFIQAILYHRMGIHIEGEKRSPVDNLTNHEEKTLRESNHTTKKIPKPTESWYFRKTAFPISVNTPCTPSERNKEEKKNSKEEEKRRDEREPSHKHSPNAVITLVKGPNQVTQEENFGGS